MHNSDLQLQQAQTNHHSACCLGSHLGGLPVSRQLQPEGIFRIGVRLLLWGSRWRSYFTICSCWESAQECSNAHQTTQITPGDLAGARIKLGGLAVSYHLASAHIDSAWRCKWFPGHTPGVVLQHCCCWGRSQWSDAAEGGKNALSHYTRSTSPTRTLVEVTQVGRSQLITGWQLALCYRQLIQFMLRVQLAPSSGTCSVSELLARSLKWTHELFDAREGSLASVAQVQLIFPEKQLLHNHVCWDGSQPWPGPGSSGAAISRAGAFGSSVGVALLPTPACKLP
jgi:hypothetical protein